jgi:putative membrane protein
MNSMRYDVANFLRILILGFWVMGFAWLLSANRYQAFIQPKLWPLLAGAFALLAIFLLAVYFRFGRPASHGAGLWSRAGQFSLLIVPLLYMRAGETMGGLGRDAFEKRSVTGQTITPGGKGIRPREQVQYSDSSPNEVDLLRMLEDMDRLENKPVYVIGRVYNDDAMPDNQYVIYRFVITCCAADALPVGALVQSKARGEFADDVWVGVTGIMRMTMVDGEPSPIIIATKVEKIDPPANPYLSPF